MRDEYVFLQFVDNLRVPKQGLQTGVMVISGLLSYDALPAVHPHIPIKTYSRPSPAHLLTSDHKRRLQNSELKQDE